MSYCQNKFFRIAGIFALVIFFSLPQLFAADGGEHHEEEKFNAGDLIIGHISDDYSWHILDWKDKAISLPLPVILYDKENGELITFSSAKFHHGHDSYKGYKIETQGNEKGKIVPVIEGTMKTDPDAARPLDFSITKNTFAVFVSAILLLWIFLSIAKSYKNNKLAAPKGMQSFLEPVIIFVRDDIAKASIGKKYEKYTPFLLTVFFFILINNLMGLIPIIPGGANVTGNLAVTGVLAFFTLVMTTISGTKAYWMHIFNAPGVPWWLKIPIPLMPVVELVGMFTKPIVLMIRLFGNILAGHIVLMGFISLIFVFGAINSIAGWGSTIVAVPFALFISMLEILVAFIQAYVFTLLSALYLGMALDEGH